MRKILFAAAIVIPQAALAQSAQTATAQAIARVQRIVSCGSADALTNDVSLPSGVCE